MRGFKADGTPYWSRGEALTSLMDNVLASKLGRALGVAEKASYGDSIDRGLSLRKALEDEGFEVRETGVPALAGSTPQPAEGDGAVAVPRNPSQDWLDKVANLLGIDSAEMDNIHAAILSATPQPAASAGLVFAARELRDLMQAVIEGEYTPDSFTLQPIDRELALIDSAGGAKG